MVNEGYNIRRMPGWYDNSLGYHTSDGEIFQNAENGKATKGIRQTSGPNFIIKLVL